MRYQNLSAFEHHLTHAAPDHLCRCYLLAVSEEAMFSQALQLLLPRLGAQHPIPQRISAEENFSLPHLFDTLQTPTLFGEEVVVLLEGAEKLGKSEGEKLAAFVKQGFSAGTLILHMMSRKLPSWTRDIEHVGIVLDLGEEKAWEKEKRLAQWLTDLAKRSGKRLAPEAARLLLERMDLEGHALGQEVEKLICYTGERPSIEPSDVLQIASSNRSVLHWQIAEEIVWGGERSAPENAPFYALVPAIRSQLEIGLKISLLLKSQTPVEEWNSHFPKLWPRILEKRREQTARKGEAYFQKGLSLLFRIELLSRTGSSQEKALLDWLCTVLRCEEGNTHRP